MKTFIVVFTIFYTVFLFPVTTPAHHQLGLPHYLYSENYPQIPTMVIDADAEGYTVTFSTFPGNPMPGETVRTKVYIKQIRSGKAFTEPVTMSVTKETFLGGEVTIVPPRQVGPDYNEYKMSLEFPGAEQYFVNVTFEPRDGFYETIPFPVVSGTTDFNLIPVISGSIFLAIFLLVCFTNKRKRKRHER